MESGGFDVIVGNPPYVTIHTNEFRGYDPLYDVVSNGVTNLATLMITRSFSLLKEGGKIGLLLPKSILRVYSYSNLRKFLMTRFDIDYLVDVGLVFKMVRGEQFILIATKNSFKKERSLPKVGIMNSTKQFRVFDYPIKSISKHENFYFFENKELYRISEKITKGHHDLNYYCDGNIFRGITTHSSNISNKRRNGYLKAIKGESIRRFSYNDFVFVKNDSFKKKKLEMRKIVLQNIFSSEAGIIANYDKEKMITLDTVTNVIPKKEDPYYILGILNSQIIRFFMVFLVYSRSKLTMHADKHYIGIIPIPSVGNVLKESIIKEVKKVISRDSHGFEYLNDLIFEAFGITNYEKKLILSELDNF